MRRLALILLTLSTFGFSEPKPLSLKERECMSTAYSYFIGLRYQMPGTADVMMEMMKMYVMRGLDLCEALELTMNPFGGGVEDGMEERD